MTQNEPKNSEIVDFLRGAGSEQAQKLCEQFLSTSDAQANDTVANLVETVGDDSLLAALKFEHAADVEQPQISILAERIEAIVPRHVITAAELSRLLDPSELPDSLGRIGRLEVIEFLASGGMGLVFRAADPDLDRDICVKLLSPSHEFHPEAKSRFDRESREMAKMNCERIVTVLEVGRQKDLPYFVMPLLPGSSLRTLLDRRGTLPAEQAVTIVCQVAEGLDYAHARGLLHRDIKPDNLWILPGGDIKILDFGLAHIDGDAAPITHSGTVIGTPSYMSPEQVNGKPLDQRSDLFSVGVVLTEMLTGKSPFQKANLFSTLMSVASETLPIEELDPDSKISAPLRPVVLGLLEKDPDNRTASAADLIEQLDVVQSGSTFLEKRVAVSSGNSTFKWIVAVAVGFAACLAALAMWNMTDKGTLVVSTDDPNVEVRIAKEQVTVIDPLTQKRHVIKIGDTPLPSGVYQLETTDSESGLSFSSQTIAIKRGEQSVVTVELISKTEPDVGDIAEAETPASEETVAAESAWADPTRNESAYTEAGQKTIASKLAKLPALDLKELGFASDNSIGEYATIANKADPTLVSLEHAAVNPTWKANADGSRKAQITKGWIQIRNPKLDKLQMMIPVPGIPRRIHWDPTNPNLLAFGCYLPKNLHESNDGQKYAIFVWVLRQEGAKLVRVYPAQSDNVLLDRGYRLFCFNDDAVKVHSLIDEQSWSVPDSSRESFYMAPISPNSRYITTYSLPDKRTQYSILDLKAGKLVQAIHGPERIQWSSDSTKLAGYVRDTTNRRGPTDPLGYLNIIDVATGNSIRRIEPDRFSLAYSSMTLSPDFGVLANAVGGGVMLMDIKSGRKSKLDFDESPGITKGKKIRWLNDSRLEITGGTKRWHFEGTQGIVGKLKLDESYVRDNPQSTLRSSILHISTLQDGSLGLIADKYPLVKTKTTKSSFYSLEVDDAGVKKVRPTLGHFIKGKFEGDDVISHSGKFVVQKKERRTHEVGVQNIESENEFANIGNYGSIDQIAWSLDEKFVVVTGYLHTEKGSGHGARIINLETMKPLKLTGIWNESARDFIPFESGFLCVAAYHRNRKWYSKLYFLDLTHSDVKKTIVDIGELNNLGKLRSAYIRESVDGRQIVEVGPHEQIKPSRVFELGNGFKLKEINSAPEFMQIRSYELPPSLDNKSSLNRELQIRLCVRHPDRPTLVCLAGKRGTTLFDMETKQTVGPLIWHDDDLTRTPVPCEEGWMLWNENTISVVDFEGNLLRRRYLYFDAATGEPTVTSWVQQNGEGLEELRKKHGDSNRFPVIRFENGEYRIE